MGKSLSEANSHSAGQEIFRLLWNPKFHYCFHKILLLVSVLSQMNPVKPVMSHFLFLHLWAGRSGIGDSISGRGGNFSLLHRVQTDIGVNFQHKWIAGDLSSGVKRPEHESGHPSPRAEVKEHVALQLHRPIRL
jgi:hypothetical protein